MKERKLKKLVAEYVNENGGKESDFIIKDGLIYTNRNILQYPISNKGSVHHSNLEINSKTYKYVFMPYLKRYYIPVFTELKSYFKRLNGLNFSREELNLMQREIYRLPIAEQAKYADEICKSSINDESMMIGFLMQLKSKRIQINKLNATAIGNIAYMALYAPPLEFRVDFQTLWVQYQEFGMMLYHG